MELAGSFSRQKYEQVVRRSMAPPQVRATNFSGLMSWEHATLMQVWKRLRRTFENLPPALQPQHQEFVNAYLSLTKPTGPSVKNLAATKAVASDSRVVVRWRRWIALVKAAVF